MSLLDYVDLQEERQREAEEFRRIIEERRREEEERRRRAEEAKRLAEARYPLPAARAPVLPRPVAAPRPEPVPLPAPPLPAGVPELPTGRPGGGLGALLRPVATGLTYAGLGGIPGVEYSDEEFRRAQQAAVQGGVFGPLGEAALATAPILPTVGAGLMRAGLGRVEAAPGVARRAAGEALTPFARALQARIGEIPEAARPMVQRLITEEAGGARPPRKVPGGLPEEPPVPRVTPEEAIRQPTPEELLPEAEVPPTGRPPTEPPVAEPSPPLSKARIEVQQERAQVPPKPPGKPPIEKALPPEGVPPGELLGRFLETQVDATAAQSDWAKFQGGLAAEGKNIDLWMRQGFKVARLPAGGKRTPDMEQLFKALHGEGPPPPSLQAVYDEVSAFMREQERITVGEVPGFQKRMIENYFPRKWRNWQLFEDLAREAKGEVPREAGLPGRRVGLPGRLPKVLPRRTLPKTFTEALELGGEPLTWNPYEFAAMHAADLAEYRYTNVLVQAWRESGRALPKNIAPRSWVVPPYRAFEAKPITVQAKMLDDEGRDILQRYLDDMSEYGKDELRAMGELPHVQDANRQLKTGIANPAHPIWGQPVAVSPEDAKWLPHILGQGTEGVENAMAYLTSVFKRSKVMFGLFQYFDLQNRTLWRAAVQSANLARKGDLVGAAKEWSAVPAAARAWGGAFIPPLRAKLWKGLMDDPVVKLGIEEGGLPIGGLDVWKRTMRSAIEPDLVMRAPIIGDIPAAKLPPGVRQAVVGTQKVMNGIYRYIASGLYDSAHPQYWSAFYKSIFSQLKTKYPEMTERQVAGMAAKDTNIMMSSIPDWHSILNPRLRQLGRGISFSVQETEAWGLRMVPRAIRGKNPELYRQQWAGYLFGTLAVAELINYAITGELLSNEQLSPVVMRNGKPTYNSRFARPRLDGDGPVGKLVGLTGPMGRHIYLDLMGQADTPFRMLNPQFFVMTRLSPWLSTAIQELQGRRFFGQAPLGGPGGKARFAVEQLVEPIPAVGFGEEKRRIGVTGAGIQAAGWNVSAEGTFGLLQRRFEEKTGRKWNEIGPNERQLVIMDDPELSRIQQEGQRTGLMREAPSAVAAQTYRQARDQWEQRIGQAVRNPQATGADISGLLEDAAADLAARGDVLFAGIEGRQPKGLLAQGLQEYNSVQMPYVGGLPDYEGYFKTRQSILDRYGPSLDREVRLGIAKRWTDPQVREAALAVFDARKVRREYYDIPTKLGMSAARQEQAAEDVARAYDEARLTGRQVRVILIQMGLPRERLMAALIYLRLPDNPARKRFRLAHANELALFEDIGVGEELMPVDRMALAGVS